MSCVRQCGLGPTLVSITSTISVLDKDSRWELSLLLLASIPNAEFEMYGVGYGACVSSLEKGHM